MHTKTPRPYDPAVVDKQIEDRFKGQFMIARGIWEMRAITELDAIWNAKATGLDCSAQAPMPAPQP